MDKKFEFDLYRINIVEDEDKILAGSRISTDEAIIQVLLNMSTAKQDIRVEGRKTVYEWSCREFYNYKDEDLTENICQIILSKSIIEQEGQTVTATGIEKSVSDIDPPLANSMIMIFWFDRHLVAVERNSYLSSAGWRRAFHNIARYTARKLEYRSDIRLEPVSPQDSLLDIFSSFTKLTRLRVRVRLPNPDLTRYTRPLFEELQSNGIRDYTQDMRNAQGLSTEEGTRQHASVALAEGGYKEGTVTFSGNKDGKRRRIVAGQDAARGEVELLKEYVRGLKSNAKTKETKSALRSVIREIERLRPKE